MGLEIVTEPYALYIAIVFTTIVIIIWLAPIYDLVFFFFLNTICIDIVSVAYVTTAGTCIQGVPTTDLPTEKFEFVMKK